MDERAWDYLFSSPGYVQEVQHGTFDCVWGAVFQETDGHQWAPVMYGARWPGERVMISNCHFFFSCKSVFLDVYILHSSTEWNIICIVLCLYIYICTDLYSPYLWWIHRLVHFCPRWWSMSSIRGGRTIPTSLHLSGELGADLPIGSMYGVFTFICRKHQQRCR